MALFDRKLLKQNRNRAAKNFTQANFLHKEIGQIITQQILDCKRNFANILEIGARNDDLGKEIANLKKAKNLIQSDLAVNFKPQIVMDDENLSFKANSFDLIISNLNLHLINNLPQNLLDINKLLKKDGIFIASFFGEENLKELRDVFYQIEQKFYNAISPRIIPNIDVKSAAMLLQKAGFKDVVAVKHNFEVLYDNPKNLLKDLKNMGEGNILLNRSKKFLTKSFLLELTNLYQKLYSPASNQSIATFEIIILNGWK